MEPLLAEQGRRFDLGHPSDWQKVIRWIEHGRRFALRQSYTKWIMTGQAV
jgi:hypothetical protein